MLEPTPLPTNSYDPVTQPDWYRAFISCACFEGATGCQWQGFFDELVRPMSGYIMFDTSPQVAGRTLGYALIYVPTIVGRDRLAHDLITCDDDPVMEEQEHDRETMVPLARNPKRFNEHLLPRDRHQCAFTEKRDIRSIRRRDIDPPPHLNGGAPLVVAHVISQYLTDGIGGISEGAQRKLQWVSSPAAILDRFAGTEVQAILDDLDVHHPANAMMLEPSARAWFNELRMWFTPVQIFPIIFRTAARHDRPDHSLGRRGG
ncbi:hypothetical protein LXA43DRAFT_263514 [Ganoderma leucocontextum]|nr:hypothetical protein LXA43DRAFT_263514 [Ganoderma leucocontextum]